jgi:hypothetical protein
VIPGQLARSPGGISPFDRVGGTSAGAGAIDVRPWRRRTLRSRSNSPFWLAGKTLPVRSALAGVQAIPFSPIRAARTVHAALGGSTRSPVSASLPDPAQPRSRLAPRRPTCPRGLATNAGPTAGAPPAPGRCSERSQPAASGSPRQLHPSAPLGPVHLPPAHLHASGIERRPPGPEGGMHDDLLEHRPPLIEGELRPARPELARPTKMGLHGGERRQPAQSRRRTSACSAWMVALAFSRTRGERARRRSGFSMRATRARVSRSPSSMRGSEGRQAFP